MAQSVIDLKSVKPLGDERPFFGKFLMKLAGIAYNAKNGIPLICFIFKMNGNENICI
jgi:hypothetical protein